MHGTHPHASMGMGLCCPKLAVGKGCITLRNKQMQAVQHNGALQARRSVPLCFPCLLQKPFVCLGHAEEEEALKQGQRMCKPLQQLQALSAKILHLRSNGQSPFFCCCYTAMPWLPGSAIMARPPDTGVECCARWAPSCLVLGMRLLPAGVFSAQCSGSGRSPLPEPSCTWRGGCSAWCELPLPLCWPLAGFIVNGKFCRMKKINNPVGVLCVPRAWLPVTCKRAKGFVLLLQMNSSPPKSRLPRD